MVIILSKDITSLNTRELALWLSEAGYYPSIYLFTFDSEPCLSISASYSTEHCDYYYPYELSINPIDTHTHNTL